MAISEAFSLLMRKSSYKVLEMGKGRMGLRVSSGVRVEILARMAGMGLTRLKLQPLFQESLTLPSCANSISYSVPNQLESARIRSTWPLRICLAMKMASG